MASYPVILAWALLLAAAGRGWGRRIDVQPSVVARGTSSWNHRPSSALAAVADGRRRHRAAFISNAPSAATRGRDVSRRRRAFLSSLMQTRTHPTSNKHSYQLCMSAEDDGTSPGVEEECSLQKLYQEVQEEDSEWYYRTFAKLLDEDEPEVPPCEGGASPEGVESARSDDGDKKDAVVGEKKEGVVANGAPEMHQKVEHPEEQLQQAKVEGSKRLDGGEPIEAEATSEEKKMPSGAEKETPELQQSQQPKGGDREEETTSEAERRMPWPSERTVGDAEGKQSSRRYEDEDAEEELDNAPTQRRQRSQPSEKAQPEPASPSPKIVRLRNIYTNEVEPLGSLAQLAKLGYSERELVVLRPQVLELIAEDGIPRPEKGLPKRWVRLSRLEGYGGEVEDEDDEDADWEVEVVSREASVNKMKEQAMQDLRAGQGEAKEEEPPETSESAARKDAKESRQREQPPLQEKLMDEDEDDEEGGSEERYDRTAKDDSGRARDRLRRPSRAKQSDTSDSRDGRYAEGRRDEDARRPAQQRRQREYDEYDDLPPRRPQRSPGDEQPRRQRSRSDGQPRRRRRLSERELLVDRGSYSDGAEPPGNQFWMNLPTFRDYLRKEAQLRLQILGPDWKESVLDESRWRYDLYKTWLTMLDEGVGENLLDDYVDRPARPSERRRTPRSRSERDYEEPSPRPQRPQRRRPERNLGDDIDEEDFGGPNRRSRSGEQRRRRSSSDYDSRPPPPRQNRSKWKNFNDLEESLQRTQRERRRPQIDYEDDRSYEPPMDKEDDFYPDEEREYAPRQRRRRPSERKRRAYVEPEDEEEEEYGEQSRREERRQSRQGRSRQYSARHEEENFDEPLEEEEADDDTSQPKRKDLRYQ